MNYNQYLIMNKWASTILAFALSASAVELPKTRKVLKAGEVGPVAIFHGVDDSCPQQSVINSISAGID
jgi:hypothetical protein